MGAFSLPINLIASVTPVETSTGWLLQQGLRSVTATAASIISMLDPRVAALLAWGLFGESLPTTGIAGAVLLLASIVLLALESSSSA